MDHETVKEAAHRYFHNNYETSSKNFCKECDAPDWRGRPDLLFIQSKRTSLHVIEAKRLETEVDQGIAQLKRYPANYRWLAIPAEEYHSSRGGIMSRCRQAGVGLLLASGNVRPRSDLKTYPDRIEGDFLDEYPKAESAWRRR